MNTKKDYNTLPPIPKSLVNLEKARIEFGDYKVNLLVELTHTGDPLADSLINEIETIGSYAQQCFSLWLDNGSLPPFDLPQLISFSSIFNYPPQWLDMVRIDRGSSAYRAQGVFWTMLALGPGSLVHTYQHPASARVLASTGNLTKMAQQRVTETGMWLINTLLPGGLQKQGLGLRHTVEVRLLHARIRSILLRRGWDNTVSGLPINQLEMTRTWLDFATVPLIALDRLGISFKKSEIDDIYHFWQYVGLLLGVDSRLLALAKDHTSAQQLLSLIDSTMPLPSADSRQLTNAMLKAVSDLARPMLGRFSPIADGLSLALARRIHGSEASSQLKLPHTWVSILMPFLVGVNRVRRCWQRRSEVSWQKVIKQATIHFHDIASRERPPTVYQQNTFVPLQNDLPSIGKPNT